MMRSRRTLRPVPGSRVQSQDLSLAGFADAHREQQLIWRDPTSMADFGLELCALGRRQSNHHSPRFTDPGGVTDRGIYRPGGGSDLPVRAHQLFGLTKGRRTLREIYTYVVDHLSEWFPDLSSYGGYVQRLNRLSDVFAVRRLVDSFPIILAQLVEVARRGLAATMRVVFRYIAQRRAEGARRTHR